MSGFETMDYDLLKALYNIKSFVGYSDEEICELSEGFEIIPSSLYELWKKCGNTSELFDCSNDSWITLKYQRRWTWTKKSKEYFYLLNENQGVYQVAIRKSDMNLDNPPVYVVETSNDGTVHEIGQAESSLIAFMMGMLIYEAGLSSSEYGAEDFIWYEEEDINKIDGILKKYPYHVYNWYSDRIDLYTSTGEEILFILQGDSPNGTYTAKTEEAYQTMDRLIGNLGER